MQEQQVRLTTIVVAVLWALGLGLNVLGIITEWYGVPGLGVLAGLAAAVLQIRGFLDSHARNVRNAFELGRDYEDGVRSLR